MQIQLSWAGHVVRFAGPAAPQETFVQRTPTRQTLRWRPEEALQRHSQSVTESLRYQPQFVIASSYGQTKVAGICSQWRKVPWSQQDCCSWATQARQGKQSLKVSDSSHHPLSTLHKNLLSADSPQKPSPHPQGQTLPAASWLYGPRRVDGRTPGVDLDLRARSSAVIVVCYHSIFFFIFSAIWPVRGYS